MTLNQKIHSIRKGKTKGFALIMVVITMMVISVLILGIMITANSAFISSVNTINTEEATYLARAVGQDITEKISKKLPDIDNQFGASNNFLSYKAGELKKLNTPSVITDYYLLFDVDNNSTEVINFRNTAKDLVGYVTIEDQPRTIARWMIVPVLPSDSTLDITRFDVVTEVVLLSDKEWRQITDTLSTWTDWRKISYVFDAKVGEVVGKSVVSISRIYGVDDLEASRDIEEFLSNYPINIIYGNAGEYNAATKTYMNKYTTPEFKNDVANSKQVYFFADEETNLKILTYPLYETDASGTHTVSSMGTATIKGNVYLIGNVEPSAADATRPSVILQPLYTGINGVGNLYLQNAKVIADYEVGVGYNDAIYIRDGKIDISNSVSGEYIGNDGIKTPIFGQDATGTPNVIRGRISAQGTNSSIKIVGNKNLRTIVEGDIVASGNIYLENVDVTGSVISTTGTVTIVNSTVSAYVRSGGNVNMDVYRNSGDVTGTAFVNSTILLANNTRVGGGVIANAGSVAMFGNVWVGEADIVGGKAVDSNKGSIYAATDMYVTKRGYNTKYGEPGDVGKKAYSDDSALYGRFTCGGNINIGDLTEGYGNLILDVADIANPTKYTRSVDAAGAVTYAELVVLGKTISVKEKILVKGIAAVIFGKEIPNATDYITKDVIENSGVTKVTKYASDLMFYNITVHNVGDPSAAGNAIVFESAPVTGRHLFYTNIWVKQGMVSMAEKTGIYKLLTPNFVAMGDLSSSVIERLQISTPSNFALTSNLTIGTLIVATDATSNIDAPTEGATTFALKDISLNGLTVDRVYGKDITLDNVRMNDTVNAKRMNGLGRNTGAGTNNGLPNPPNANSVKFGLIGAGGLNEGSITINNSIVFADMAGNNITINTSQIGSTSKAFVEKKNNRGGIFTLDAKSNKKYTGSGGITGSTFGPDIMIERRENIVIATKSITTDTEENTWRNSYGFGAINSEDSGESNFGDTWNVLKDGNVPLENGNFRNYGNWAIFDNVPGNISVSGNLKIFSTVCDNITYPIQSGKANGIYAGGSVQIYCSNGDETLQIGKAPTDTATYSYVGYDETKSLPGTIFAGKGIQIINAGAPQKFTIEGDMIIGEAYGSFTMGTSDYPANVSTIRSTFVKGNIEHRGNDAMYLKGSLLGVKGNAGSGNIYTKAPITIENTTLIGGITKYKTSEPSDNTATKGQITIKRTDGEQMFPHAWATNNYYIGGDIVTSMAVYADRYQLNGSIKANGWNDMSATPTPASVSINLLACTSPQANGGRIQLYAPNGGIITGGLNRESDFRYNVNNIYAKYDVTIGRFTTVTDSTGAMTTGITSQLGGVAFAWQDTRFGKEITVGAIKIVATTDRGTGSYSLRAANGRDSIDSKASLDIANAEGDAVFALSNWAWGGTTTQSLRLRNGDLNITASVNGTIYLDRGMLSISSGSAYGTTVSGDITCQKLYAKNAVIGKQIGTTATNTNYGYSSAAELANKTRTKLLVKGTVKQIDSTIIHSDATFVGGMNSERTDRNAEESYEISGVGGATVFYGKLMIGKYKSDSNVSEITSKDIYTKGHVRIENAATIIGNVFCNVYFSGLNAVSSGDNVGWDFGSANLHNAFTVSIEGTFTYLGDMWIYSKIFIKNDFTAAWLNGSNPSILVSGNVFVGGTSVIRGLGVQSAENKASAMYIVKGKTLAHGNTAGGKSDTFNDKFIFNDVDFGDSLLDGALCLGTVTSSGNLRLGSKVMLRGDFVINRDLNVNGYGRDVGELTARNIYIVSNEGNRRQIGVWKVTAMKNLYVVRNNPTAMRDVVEGGKVVGQEIDPTKVTTGCDVFWNYRANGTVSDVGNFNVRGSSSYKPNLGETEGKANIRVLGNAILGKNFKAQNKTLLWVGGGVSGYEAGYLLFDTGFRMWQVYVNGHVGGNFRYDSNDVDNACGWNGEDRSQKQQGIVKSIVCTGLLSFRGFSPKSHWGVPAVGMAESAGNTRIVVGGNRDGVDANCGVNGQSILAYISSFTNTTNLDRNASICWNGCKNGIDGQGFCTCNDDNRAQWGIGGKYVAVFNGMLFRCDLHVKGSTLIKNSLFATYANNNGNTYDTYSMMIGDAHDYDPNNSGAKKDDNLYLLGSVVGAPARDGDNTPWGDSARNTSAGRGAESCQRGYMLVEGNIKHDNSAINYRTLRYGFRSGGWGGLNNSIFIGGCWNYTKYDNDGQGRFWTAAIPSWGGGHYCGVEWSGQTGENFWADGRDWSYFMNHAPDNSYWKTFDRFYLKPGDIGYDSINPANTTFAGTVFPAGTTFAEYFSPNYAIVGADVGSISTETYPDGSIHSTENNRTSTVNGYTVGGVTVKIQGNVYRGFTKSALGDITMKLPDIHKTFTVGAMTARPTFSIGDLLNNAVTDGGSVTKDNPPINLPTVDDSLKPYSFKDPIKVNPLLANGIPIDLSEISKNVMTINSSGVLDLSEASWQTGGKIKEENKTYKLGNDGDSITMYFDTRGKDMHIILKKGYSIEIDGKDSQVVVLGTGRVFIYAYPGSNFIVKNGSEIGRVDANCVVADGSGHPCQKTFTGKFGNPHVTYDCTLCVSNCARCTATDKNRSILENSISGMYNRPLCSDTYDKCGFFGTYDKLATIWSNWKSYPCPDCVAYCRTKCPTCMGTGKCYLTHLGKPCPQGSDSNMTKLYFVGLPIVDAKGKPSSETVNGVTLDENTPTLLSFGNGVKVNAFFYMNASRNVTAEFIASDQTGDAVKDAMINNFVGSLLANNIIFRTNAKNKTYTFASRYADLTYIDYGNGLHHAIDPPDDYDSDNNDKWGVDKIN